MKAIQAVLSVALISLGTHAFAQSAAPAATQTTPTVRVNTRLVIVDVVATDKSGKVVPGLKATDFKIFDNGHEQKMRFFEEHTSPRTASSRDIPKLPPNQFTNF